jgi:hypothetical protein
VGIEHSASRSAELVFARDAFVAVQPAFHAVLENARRFGHQADDLKAPLRRAL